MSEEPCDVRIHLTMQNGRFVETVSDDFDVSLRSSDGLVDGYLMDVERFLELSIRDGCSVRIDLPLQQKVILVSSGDVEIKSLAAPLFITPGARRIVSMWEALEV